MSSRSTQPAKVSFCKDGVQYEREYFVSHPANVMAVRFAASQRGKQNLVFSYAPNPVSTGEMKADGADALCWLARLDNNAMQYAVRIKAVAKGGAVSNEGGKLTVKNATRWCSSSLPTPTTSPTTTPTSTTRRLMWASTRQRLPRLARKGCG